MTSAVQCSSLDGSPGHVREVTRQEWIWVAVVAALIVAASTVPYLAGYLVQTPQMRFGGAVLGRTDYHSHLAKMWQGYRGGWRYRLLFTPEDHEGAYVQMLYVALGHLARLTRLGLPFTYQLARMALGFLMLLSVYRFVAHFVASVRIRRVAFLLATVASGLGWIKELIARTPPDGVSPMSFWLIDAYTYLSLLTFPHFCLAVALLLGVYLLLLRRPEGPSLKEGALATVGSLGLGLIHPYMLLVADSVPILHWALEGSGARRFWRGLRAVAAMGVLQAPLLMYVLWLTRTQPVFAGWSVQNVTLSPPLSIYLWGHGPLLVLGLIGVVAGDTGGERDQAFLLLWIGFVVALVYMPWNLQRRFLEGVQVPLGLLAALGLVHIAGRLRSARLRGLASAAVVGMTAISNIYMTTGLTLGAASRHPGLFWSHEVLTAVDWLGENASWNQTVLAGPETGSLIPARIGHRVVLGHGIETVDYEGKREALVSFFSTDTSNTHRLTLVREWEVSWVFHGPNEKKLGGFEPDSAPWLVPALQSPSVTVYRVSPGQVP